MVSNQHKDLRQFLQMARKAGSDYYVEVKKPLAVDLEVCVIQQKLARQGRNPVIYCPEMKGVKLPYCTNLYGSYELLGLALDIEPDTLKQRGKAQVQQEYMKRLKERKPVQWVSEPAAPVKDVIIKGKDIDLSTLPIVKHYPLDSGKYITAGAMICKDADKGITNMGVYRHEVQGRNKLGCHIGPLNHGSYIARRYAELSQTMEIAIYIGHHPAVGLGATARGTLEDDEFEIAAGFLGEPLRVTKGETVDLPIPADAEIVVEGRIDPNKWVNDGPLAEYAGYYGDRRPSYLIEVTCITMRKDAIYQGLDTAHQEHNLWMVLPGESSIYEMVKKRVPTVRAVHAPPFACRHHYYISIAKRVPGEGMIAGLLAVGGELHSKMIVIVDDDIDVFDEEQVQWALATRVSWDKDIAVIPRVHHSEIDPRSYGEAGLDYETGEVGEGQLIGRVIIDATKPATLPYATTTSPPEDLWKSIKLEEYI